MIGHLNAQNEITFKNEGNPLVKHIYTADPSAHVFNDRIYVYTSHDEDDATYFDMLDWHVFSTDNFTAVDQTLSTNWTQGGIFKGRFEILLHMNK